MTRGKPQQERALATAAMAATRAAAAAGAAATTTAPPVAAAAATTAIGVLRQRAAPQAATALALRKTHDQARGHSVHGTQPRPRRVDVPQHLIATPSALGRPKRDRAVGEDDRASVYFATRESTV